MPRPAALQKYWDEHPETAAKLGRPSLKYPHRGSVEDQADWFKRQFLKLADAESDPKEKAALLKLAFGTLKKAEGGGDDPTKAFREELVRKTADLRAKKEEADA